MLRSNDLDDLIEQMEGAYKELEFPEPKEWMRQTEQVLEAYKNEVEMLRRSVRDMQAAMTRIALDQRAVKDDVKGYRKLLQQMELEAEKAKGRA